MKHEELLWAINSVVENGPCDSVGHWSSAKALLAVVELHKPLSGWVDGVEVENHHCECDTYDEYDEYDEGYPCETLRAIEEQLQ